MTQSNVFYAMLALALITPSLASARADHLLISECLVRPGGLETDTASSEFVEIFNPTSTPVSLANYYLSDYKEYYLLPAGNFDFGDRSDFLLRFPADAVVAPGATVVVTQSSVEFLSQLGSSFGGNLGAFGTQPGTPQLFEVANTNPNVPDMINLKSGNPRAESLGLNNTGGFVALFYWDGASDLVKDVDIVRWGTPTSANALQMKTGISVDGPDADLIPSTYAADMGASASTYTGSNVVVMRRVDVDEPGENGSANGNGLTGHDETTENLHSSFASIPEVTINPGIPNGSLIRASVDNWQVY